MSVPILAVARLMGLLLGAYGLLCAAMFLLQRSLLYFPTPPRPGATPTLTLAVDGVPVRVVVAERPGRRALLYFGGNAEDVTETLPVYAAAFPDRALYLMHYRGYGTSGGRPSETALLRDAEALYAQVEAEHPEITVVGRSLGSGPAVHLAARHRLERLVLITPYDSILRVARQQYPWLPVDLLLRDRFESWRLAPQVRTPTSIVAAGNDTLIPAARSGALLAAFPEGVARLRTVPGADHHFSGREGDLMAEVRTAVMNPR